MPEPLHHPASYRDPSGFVFRADGIYYRQVNQSYTEDYSLLMGSGLYNTLVEKKLLIGHEEIAENITGSNMWYKTLLPDQLPFITYPYEWCFEQLRDAALLTLTILSQSIQRGMILKDASPFNIQFLHGKPIFIDTLSFERYDAALPWVAYRQFCECFLYPLYLEHFSGIALGKMLTAYSDGIPANVASRLLPWKSRFNAGALMHVHLQQMVKAGKQKNAPPAFSKQKLMHIIQNLENIIKGLKTRVPLHSTWNNYYEGTILSRSYLDEKEKLFRQYLEGISFRTALDMGANDGYFSEILAGRGDAAVLAIDADEACIDRLYLVIQKKKITNLLPLCIDILHPSAAIGWRNKERASFHERFRPDLITALALIHHLVLSGNVPLADLPGFFAELTTHWLIIEFVPLEDEKAQELIRNKQQWHLPYDAATFEQYFQEFFLIGQKSKVPGTERMLYLMEKKLP